MSLLFGSWTARSSDDDQDDLARCATALGRYPGMDRVRQVADDGGFLAHAQTIVTPEDRHERQPSLHGGGRFALAMDGFLANRDELIEATALEGVPSDSAVVAAALLRWGEAALERMHGDFALAWWDRAERRLLLACDRVGGRALYYHATDRRLVCANLIASLFVHPSVPRAVDGEMVARAAFTYALDLERTCFQDVRQLLPGHKLVWTPAGMRVGPYWRLDPALRIRLRRDEDYVEAARDLLDKVVGEAARMEGPRAAMLSGGLDSGAVATTAARLTAPEPLHTLTVRSDPSSALPPCPAHRFQDEWPHAQAVAALHPSIVAHGEPAQFDPIEDALRADMTFTGRPPNHLLGMMWMASAWRKARSLGAKVVLTGLSGNATLSASTKPALLRPGLADLPAATLKALDEIWRGRRLGPAKALALSLLPGDPPWADELAVRPQIAERIGMRAVRQAFMTGERRAPWGARARLRLMERTWASRSTAASLGVRRGVEARDPLGDARLAQFCLAIPSNQFTRGAHDRLLARRVLADRLPPLVVREQRRGRQAAEWFDWLSRSRPWLEAELDRIEDTPLGRELIDVPRLRTILDDWPSDAATAEPHYRQLMTVMGRGVALGSFIRWAEGANR